MLPYKSPRRCSGALIMVVLTVYLLLILPSPSHGESLDLLKEEQQRRNTEPKLESDSDSIGVNGAGAARTLFGNSNRRNQRSIGYGPRFFPISRSKIPIELELMVNNEEAERPKRFDDYGHMRFGKRGNDEQFDDYGHMRFGR